LATDRSPGQRGGARAAAAVVVLACAGIALSVLLAPGQGAAATLASWRAYQAAAQSWIAAGPQPPAQPPDASPLRADAVLWPDGTALVVSPAAVTSGLGAPPRSPEGRAARAALTLVAEAPAVPPPVAVPLHVAEARFAAILRAPAFAAARPGPMWRLGLRLSTAWSSVLTSLAAVFAWIGAAGGAVPPPVQRIGGIVIGGAGVAAAVWVGLRLLRGGLERSERERRAPASAAVVAPPEAVLAAAADALTAGDLALAVRLAYREAVRAVTARLGIAVRPGWTARDIRRAGGLDDAWPGFLAVARLHARVVFGPPPGGAEGARLAGEVGASLEEVRRWVRAPQTRAATAPSGYSPPPAS